MKRHTIEKAKDLQERLNILHERLEDAIEALIHASEVAEALEYDFTEQEDCEMPGKYEYIRKRIEKMEEDIDILRHVRDEARTRISEKIRLII